MSTQQPAKSQTTVDDLCINTIRTLSMDAIQKDQTQIFIETPYRNRQMLESLIRACKPGTRICVAADLTLPGETIITATAKQWSQNSPDLNKRPAVFLLYR